MYSLIETEHDAAIAHLRLNDPPANTLTYDLIQQLERSFIDALLHPAIAGIVLSGKGERFFSGGVNIGMLSHVTPHYVSNFVLYASEVFNLIARSTKPVIAAINGHATGGGLELALLAQHRVAKSGDYHIGLPETRLGVIPGLGGTQRLSRLIGADAAFELICDATLIGPERARELGIVDEVVASADFDSRVIDAVLRLTDGGHAPSSRPPAVFPDTGAGAVIERHGHIGVLAVRGDGADDPLRRLAAINHAVLDLRADAAIKALIVHVDPVADNRRSHAPADRVTLQLLTDYVARRIANFPGICAFYSDVLPDDLTYRIAAACDFRFTRAPHAPPPGRGTRAGITVPREAGGVLFSPLAETDPIRALLDRMARYVPPLGASAAITAAKHAIQRGLHLPLDDAQFLERRLQEPLLRGKDGQEGMNAYLAKRMPVFSGE